jgi:hypothetical protein
MLLSEIRAKHIIIWHDEWSQGGQTIDMAYQIIGHLRTSFGFGAVVLENQDCERPLVVMRDKRLSFPMGEPREEIITAEQATAIRTKASQLGHFPITLVQALQFDLMLRQKDCPGEWVPMSEPGVSDVHWGRTSKWLRGLRWKRLTRT